MLRSACIVAVMETETNTPTETMIANAKAEALREAAEATVADWRPVFYEDESDEWANDKVARWLRSRADHIARGGVA